MESTEKCEAIIQHFNGKFIKSPPGVPGVWNVLFNIVGVGGIFLFSCFPLCFSQCPQSRYYVSLPTGVRRRGRTRASTSRMEDPGPETEMRWDEHILNRMSVTLRENKQTFLSFLLWHYDYDTQVLNPKFCFFPGRNDACIWPNSLTKWVRFQQELTENGPSPPDIKANPISVLPPAVCRVGMQHSVMICCIYLLPLSLFLSISPSVSL